MNYNGSMTRTEAAEIIALDVRVWCRRNGKTPSLLVAQERVSELRGENYQGNLKGDAANLANPKTVARIAAREWLAS
jgi:hypothetical protein